MQVHNYLSASVKTWNRDSHGLYDYENTNAKTSNQKITKDQILIRNRNDIKSESYDKYFQTKEEDEFLLKVIQNENGFSLKNDLNFGMAQTEENIHSLQNKLWLPVKPDNQNSLNANVGNRDFNHHVALSVNDIIKVGRVKFSITAINVSKEENEMDVDPVERKREVIKLVPKLVQGAKQNANDCKICLSNTEDEENIFVRLCNCSGSIADVHVNCVKMWMATKITKKSNEKSSVNSYYVKSFNCEICKKPYPLKFELNGKEFSLIDLEGLSGNFMIMESLNQAKEDNNYKSVHVIGLNNGEKVLLGRGHDCDIRINDISVSRKHACLELVNGEVVLKDLFSKFGTLILQQNDIKITENPIFIQIGRSLGKFCLEKNSVEEIEIKKNVSKEFNEVKTSSPKNLSGEYVFQIDKNFENMGLNGINTNFNPKSKILFKVEKVENKNGSDKANNK